MRRSAVLSCNIAEGFDRGSRAEFHKFLVIAKGSCAELRSQLVVALDAGFLDLDLYNNLTGLALETNRIMVDSGPPSINKRTPNCNGIIYGNRS